MTSDDRSPTPEPDLPALVAARYALGTHAVGPPTPEPGAVGSTVLAHMLGHRTCRRYQPEPVSDGLLELILAATFSTPSKSDLQQCTVIVVDDPGRRAAIGALIPSMPWIVESARFLLFCGDSRRVRGIAARAGLPFANDHLDAVLNAAGDAAMHLSSFVWAAESVGLGTCPISVVRDHIEEVSAIVELPDQVFPFAGMCVGWPEKLRPLSPRLPAAVTVHHDCYDDREVEPLIADYDERRSAGRTVPAEHQVDVEQWGVADPYGWSTEKARMVARRERDQLARFLRTKGLGLD